MRITFILLTIIIMLALATSGFAGLHTERLLLLWNCDEGKGNILRDASGNSWDAMIKAGRSKWAAGMARSNGIYLQLAYAQVDGNIIETIGDTGEITMMSWFKMGGQHTGYDSLITIKPPEGECCPYRLMVNPNRNPFWNAGHRVDKSLPSFIFELERWYHYALTADGRTSKIYVDGDFRVEQAENIKLPKLKEVVVYLGTGEEPGTHSMEDATFDEVMIWDKALGRGEIKEVYGGLTKSVSPKGKLPTTWGSIKMAY